MLEYEFETVQCDYGSGYSLFGGIGLETDGPERAGGMPGLSPGSKGQGDLLRALI